jgi:septal ring factor EnvC (AmiA/AmiB activator)
LKAKIDKQINEQNTAKKEAGKGLGEIKDTIKKLQTEIDFVKAHQTEK